jgi:hypothetical protein
MNLANPTIRPDLRADAIRTIQQTLQNQDKTHILEEFFLEKLAFKAMKDREEEVSPAHRATFEWIFETSSNDDSQSKSNMTSTTQFASWLSSSDASGVYWINGKAGSGKSTLMRYIWQHQKTTHFLNKWASDKPLVSAAFYFWTSGTPEQRSQTGLLRYLLHQLLSQRKEMIPWVFPELWLRCQDTKNRVTAVLDWSTEVLISGFQRFLRDAVGKIRICLFIDGLDELDGDQGALVGLLRFIVDLSPRDFKICVSSRPWPIFEKSFCDVPHFQVQDLSVGDIRQYVDDYLDCAPKARRIAKKEPDSFLLLKARITQNADGVFLWATLCTKTLVARIAIGDTMTDLDAKLAQLPTDLDDLYRYLLFENRPKEELREQSRILQIIRAREIVCDFTKDESSSSMTAYQLALADPGEALDTHAEVRRPSAREVLGMYETLKTHLASRCANLVVLHCSDSSSARTQGARFLNEDNADSRLLAQSRVGYIHRTVRDFLIYSGAFEFVKEQVDETFDPYVCLLKSHLFQLLLPLEKPEQHRRLDEWWPDVLLAMTSARLTKPISAEVQVNLLNKFKSTLDWYWLPKKSDPLDNWARNAFATYELRMKHKTPYHYPFLSLTTKFGLYQYVETELRTRGYAYQGGIPLLSHAIEFLASRRHTVYPLSSLKLVDMLLANGHDPNLSYKDLFGKETTPWLLALKYVSEAHRRGWIQVYDLNVDGTMRWVGILKLFVLNGADPNALIVEDSWDPAATALDVVTEIYQSYLSHDFKQLLQLLVEWGAITTAQDTRANV